VQTPPPSPPGGKKGSAADIRFREIIRLINLSKAKVEKTKETAMKKALQTRSLRAAGGKNETTAVSGGRVACRHIKIHLEKQRATSWDEKGSGMTVQRWGSEKLQADRWPRAKRRLWARTKERLPT